MNEFIVTLIKWRTLCNDHGGPSYRPKSLFRQEQSVWVRLLVRALASLVFTEVTRCIEIFVSQDFGESRTNTSILTEVYDTIVVESLPVYMKNNNAICDNYFTILRAMSSSKSHWLMYFCLQQTKRVHHGLFCCSCNFVRSAFAIFIGLPFHSKGNLFMRERLNGENICDNSLDIV